MNSVNVLGLAVILSLGFSSAGFAVISSEGAREANSRNAVQPPTDPPPSAKAKPSADGAGANSDRDPSSGYAKGENTDHSTMPQR